MIEGDLKICMECVTFLSEIHQFVTRTKLIDTMFMEMAEVEQQFMQHPEALMAPDEIAQLTVSEMPPPLPREYEYEKSLNSLRLKFGLKPLETQVEVLINLFDESITGALEIKLESEIEEEDENDDHDLSESDEEEEEDESEIEQLSDSQLRKHEESLHQGESSDTERERPKMRKKKYRKSDEEKLFE